MKKHIYIYSPSGAVRDKVAFKRGVARLKAQGHEIEIDPDALSSYQRFAGDDATRLAAIHRAAASGADVALMSRGGYGITRILPGIQYKKVAKAVGQGMRFVGISDFTAFQSAVLAKSGAVTWAGPALCEGFGVGGQEHDVESNGVPEPAVPDEIMQACFDDMLLGQGEGAGWRQNPQRTIDAPELVVSKSTNKRSGAEFIINNSVLWGGNLAVLTSLLGTPYFPDIKGGILFLEDVAEHPYRIERMLTQLLHAGVLARQKAIVMGQFTDYQLIAHDRGFKFQSVVGWLRSKVKTPVLTNLPYGHVQTKVLLPVGAKVDLNVEGRDAMLLWGHV